MAQYFEAVGRRKESTARVRVTEGSGQFIVNEKPLDVYFPRIGDAPMILSALEAAGQNPSLTDVTVKVEGGGISGQRDAVKLGLARALVSMDEGARKGLREKGLLTRDARIKERKKPGLKRARKAPTYTKR
ncbi:MAG TPA: 30S ribosomal protein S9 [Anaerolineaceae bacterium]|jgi:small subunit ribosomal protein S9|nr:30S ribosomal protein S9 [Anaerolineales bacterium]HOT52644.1 30S ribosomal protein S9 [Anaerolineaceae bacterium]HQK42409.1 30S ribosomal protein S9 [Anaerolineaceae bacterium]